MSLNYVLILKYPLPRNNFCMTNHTKQQIKLYDFTYRWGQITGETNKRISTGKILFYLFDLRPLKPIITDHRIIIRDPPFVCRIIDLRGNIE